MGEWELANKAWFRGSCEVLGQVFDVFGCSPVFFGVFFRVLGL